MFYSLMYVSRSALQPSLADAAVDDIVATSRFRNRQLGVTGALLFTGSQFAQILEGSQPSVEQLMRSIARDPRHEEVKVIVSELLDMRRFARWTLAYSGPSVFVDRAVSEARRDATQGQLDGATKLIKVMAGLA